MVIVTNIWQKLSSVERDVTLIATNFWQLFSQIFGETSLIVINIWRNRTSFREYVNPSYLRPQKFCQPNGPQNQALE